MRYGITFTHNSDLMYVGPRRIEGSSETTDMVIAWSDNPFGPGAGPDNLTFIFTSGNGTGTGATAAGGLEVARMTAEAHTGIGNGFNNNLQPRRTLHTYHPSNPQFRIAQSLSTNINAGNKADFQTSNLGNLHVRTSNSSNQVRAVAIGFLPGQQANPINNADFPTRLDVGGVTRIRDLPDYERMDCIVLGRNPGPNPEDNFLGRIDFPTGDDTDCLVLNADAEWINVCDNVGGDDDCRWKDIASQVTMGEIDMYTGVDPLEDCYRGKVGIGVPSVVKSKLQVENLFDRDGVYKGIYSRSRVFLDGVNERIIGVFGEADSDGWPGAITTNIGVLGQGGDSRYTVGVMGNALSHPNGNLTGSAIGVAAIADGNAVTHNIAIYGEATTPGGFAGYFTGGNIVFAGNQPIFISDESIKTEVEDITEATELLMALNPKSYYFQSPDNRPIAFDDTKQFGLIAQEVQEILPEIVKPIVVPEMMDSTGFVDGTSADLLGIQYDALIPFIIAAFKEQQSVTLDQQAEIAAQQDLIESLQTQLEAQNEQMLTLMNAVQDLTGEVDQAKSNMDNCCQQKPVQQAPTDQGGSMHLGQNAPNPFSDQTRIDFTIPEGAQVVLEISDSQGRKLDKLVDGYLGEGKHSVTWDGARYSPGMYYYSLFSNGTLLTKKMIKR